MTLAFSQAINGKLTHFPEKILNGLVNNELIKVSEYRDLQIQYVKKAISTNWIFANKIHTIRRDEKNKWKVGNKIHFVIYNRTPQRYQFAPIVPCMSVQAIKIKYCYNRNTKAFDTPIVMIGDKQLSINEETQLAINDGFQSSEAFFNYFDKDFTGKIIHWTDKQY